MGVLERWTKAPLKNALVATFQTEATVKRLSQVADTTGGFTDTYTTAATYPCTFTRFLIRPREQETAGRIRNVSYWAFHFTTDADIRATDRLQVGTRMFEVVGVGQDSTVSPLLEIIAMEIV